MEISLLKVDEYQKYRENIKNMNSWWWLQDMGNTSDTAAVVYPSGFCNIAGESVRFKGGLRPVLRVSKNLVKESSDKKHTKIETNRTITMFAHNWTHIGSNLFLCDELITSIPYDDGTGIWDSSNIKKYLENFVKKYL